LFVLPIFPCLQGQEQEHRNAWVQALLAVQEMSEGRLKIDGLLDITPGYLIDFDPSDGSAPDKVVARWEQHATARLDLTQRLLKKGVQNSRPSTANDLKAFSVVIAGDVSTQEGVGRAVLNVIGSALLDLKVRFPEAKLSIVLVRLPKAKDHLLDAAG